MTGNGWTGPSSDCCYEQTFSYDEEQPILIYYVDLFRGEYRRERTWLAHFATPKPRHFYIDAVPADIDVSLHCCGEGFVESVGKRDTRWINRSKYRGVIKVQYYNVTIKLKIITDDCLGTPVTPKYALSIKQSFVYGTYQQHLEYSLYEETWTILDNCYEISPPYAPSPPQEFGVYDWDDWTGALEIPILPLPPTIPAPSGSFTGGTFIRHKFYETLPETITLGATDVPTTPPCPFACENINESTDEFCFSFLGLVCPFGVLCNPLPGWCNDPDTNILPELTTRVNRQLVYNYCTIPPPATSSVWIFWFDEGFPCRELRWENPLAVVGTANCPTLTKRWIDQVVIGVFRQKASCYIVEEDPCGVEYNLINYHLGYECTNDSVTNTCEHYYEPTEYNPNGAEVCITAPDITLNLGPFVELP
jgi:hypothetical protein